jgi:tetratricopeptide (TPR) repeat protein
MSLPQNLLREIDQLCRQGDLAAAIARCGRAIDEQPASADLHLLASQLHQRGGAFARMAECAAAAVALAPNDCAARLRQAEAQIYGGRIDLARRLLADTEDRAETRRDPALLQQVAQLYLHCASHADALRCHEQAVAWAPQQAGALYNLASSCVAAGDIDRAESLFDQVIRIDPSDLGAQQNRSMLRTWHAGRHHLQELQSLLAGLPDNHAGRVPLCYALAKELEDLGDDALSFQYLQQGARLRRQRLAYRVETDVQAMARIAEVFDAPRLAQRGAVGTEPAAEPERAWFVLGLPRSGTTLVERILGSHSQLASLGEIDSFAFALMQLASDPAGASGKLAMIDRSAGLDHARLGALYRGAIASFGVPAPGLINKTPQNYLYLGLIHLALPGARIVHLRRHPLDSCYAMYKTLFRMGYPFSYSLEDLGHYYLAYHRLMAHWRACVPGSFIDIDYEALVDDQVGVTRRLLSYGALPWEDACLDFHHNPTPAATASATQVRQPIYRSSMRRWQAHAEQLAPLADFLTAHGVNCE